MLIRPLEFTNRMVCGKRGMRCSPNSLFYGLFSGQFFINYSNVRTVEGEKRMKRTPHPGLYGDQLTV